MSIEIRHVSKQFGDFRALNDLTLDIDTGELWRCSARPGSGKTTLLRIIAGLDTPDRGRCCSTTRTDRRRRARAKRRLRLPALRPVPAHDRVRERRVRPARAARRQRPRESEIRATRAASLLATGAARTDGGPLSGTSFPAGSGSASRWPGRWRSSRRCCCSTSRSARSTPRCARSCAAGCAACTTRST